MFRVEELALDRFELYVGLNASPDLTLTPDETFLTLPHTTTLTLTISATNHLVTLKRDRFNLRGEVPAEAVEQLITLDGAGAEVLQPPNAPSSSSLEQLAGGKVRVLAERERGTEPTATQGDQFSVRVRSDGVDATPADAAVLFDIQVLSRRWLDRLDEEFGGFADGADVRVLIRTRRKLDTIESTNLTNLQIFADAVGPTAPVQDVFIDESVHVG